jgi:hypothetical protein
MSRELKNPPKITINRSTIFMGIREIMSTARMGMVFRSRPILKVSSGLKYSLIPGRIS